MARGLNIRSRQKITEALETIHSPFTSGEMATITGLTAKKIQGLLRGFDNIEKETIPRGGGSGYDRGQVRCLWRVVE